MNRVSFYKYTLSLGVVLGSLAIIFIYYLYMAIINTTLKEVEGVMIIVFLFLIRIGLLSISAFYMFKRWFTQEQQFLTDLPFLFGLFFLFLTYGKALELLSYLIYISLDASTFLFITKTRFFLIVATAAPMMYISIGMILYYLSLKNKYENLKIEAQRNKWARNYLLIIILVELTAVIMAPSLSMVIILLPIFVFPSFAIIVWLFYFSYKNKALSLVNTKILAIGFGVLLISQLLRSILQFIIGLNILYLFITELIDFFVFLIIIVGFFTKSKYASKEP